MRISAGAYALSLVMSIGLGAAETSSHPAQHVLEPVTSYPAYDHDLYIPSGEVSSLDEPTRPKVDSTPPNQPNQPHQTPVETASETIVSLLSQSAQHTTLLHLLQRSKCIPLLAHIGSATVFAPTDAAWEEWAKEHTPAVSPDGDAHTSSSGFEASVTELYAGWLGPGGLNEWRMSYDQVLALRMESGDRTVEEETAELDNQNWALRQHLLYHMLNYTLSPTSFQAIAAFTSDEESEMRTDVDSTASATRNITTLTTLLFPLDKQPAHPPVPPPGAPWLPRGGDGMLGGHGQRLRLARAGSREGGERGRVGGDWKGEGGASVWDGQGWKDGKGNDTLSGEESGGRKGVKGVKWVSNGVVVGIEAVLDMPPSIDEIIATHPSLSYLSHLLSSSSSSRDDLPSPLPPNLRTTPHLTVFASANPSFDAFDPVEKRYLESEYGGEGVGRIAGGGILIGLGKDKEPAVGWSDYWGKKRDRVQSVSGTGLEIAASPNGDLIVNGTTTEVVDIFASNGVVHIVPHLLVPEGFTLLNSAEKVLLSLNATRFVSLLRSANISSMYAGEPGKDGEKSWTILAPNDEVLNAMDRWGSHGRPLPRVWNSAPGSWGDDAQGQDHIESINDVGKGHKDASPLAALLQYHIIPGRVAPGDIKDGMLLGTELRTSALDGGRQRLRVDVSQRFGKEGMDWDNVEEGEIRFGGATVIAKPVKSGKSIIYLISSLLSPPDDVLQTAVSDLQLSTFIAAVYAANLDHTVKSTPAVSYFMPRNKAFNALGLAMKYLLLPEGKDELRKVVKYHAVDEVIYSPDMQEGRETYETLHGGDVLVQYSKGDNASTSTIRLASPSKWEGHDSGESVPANGEIRPALVTAADALTSTGVIHTIDSVVMPADVSITIAKLIRGSRQSTMLDLMIRAGLGWVLEGREPSSAEVQRVGLDGIVRAWDNDSTLPNLDELALPGYTLLCPTDTAFSQINLTAYIADPPALVKLLKLHIIPTQPSVPRTQTSKLPATPPRDGHPLSLDDDLVYQTLLSGESKYGDLAIRATGDNSFLVGVRNARGGTAYGADAARLGDSGRASVRWRKGREGSEGGEGGDEGRKVGGLRVEGLDDGDVLWRGGMTLGGGVVMIDNVLLPYEPSWFTRWGWLVITLSGIGLILVIAAASVGWWWMTRDKEVEGYEPLEGEEED